MTENKKESRTGRSFQFRVQQAITLLGEFVSNAEFKAMAGNLPKSSYHAKFSPADIRRVRETLHPEITEYIKGRKRPPVICVHTSKGGTGKSAVAANLSTSLAMQGWRVALIDGDAASSGSTEILGCQDDERDLITLRDIMIAQNRVAPEDAFIRVYDNAELYLLPADPGLGRMEIELAFADGRETLFSQHLADNANFYRQFDFVIIDTSPNATLLNLNFMFAANLTLAPVMLDGGVMKAMRSLQYNLDRVERLTKVEPQVMLVPNAYHSGMAHRVKTFGILKEAYPENLSKTTIPTYAGFERQIRLWEDYARPLVESEPSTSASKAIMEVSRELVDKFIKLPTERMRNGKR